MSKYALVFSESDLIPIVAEQMTYLDEGYFYVEAEPVIKVVTSDFSFFSKTGNLKFKDQKIGEFSTFNFKSGVCFLVPLKFVRPLNASKVVEFELDYDSSISTKLTKKESGFQCFGSLAVLF